MQSKVQTDDVGRRNEFKQRLADKVQVAIETRPVVSEDPMLLLLPVGYDSMSEPELLFALTQNSEFQQSNDTAPKTVDILYGRTVGVDFRVITVDVPSMKKLPQFVSEAPVQRKLSKKDPRFSLPVDSRPEREAREEAKRLQIEQGQTLKRETAPVAEVHTKPVQVVLPEGYKTMSGRELFVFLTTNLHLTPEQANDVLYIEAGFPQKTNFEFDLIGLKQDTPVIPTPREEPAPVKVILPYNYVQLSDRDLYLYLIGPGKLPSEQANDIVGVIHGKAALTGLQYEITIEEHEEL